MARTLTFLLETSPTPIYQRISGRFGSALEDAGHRVLPIAPETFASDHAFFAHVAGQAADYYLSTNPLARIGRHVESDDAFGFELVDIPMIFVHHDGCFFHLLNPDRIRKLLEGYCRCATRSTHFFLERHQMEDLQALGIDRTHLIPHASEFDTSGDAPGYDHAVSFVGHLLPGLTPELERLPWSERLLADFHRRLAAMDYRIAPSAAAFAKELDLEDPLDLNRTAIKSFYLVLTHMHFQQFRGEIVRRLRAPISIVGGDPAYLQGPAQAQAASQRISQPNIRYLPATANYVDAQSVYARSAINLNITSLQFDQAVINRVIDAAAAGGFVLTDWKDDLAQLTGVANEISYRTVEELNDKIGYFLDPSHARRRREITEALHHDVQRSCAYPAVVESLLSKLAR